MKTSWKRLLFSSSEDAFKTNIFAILMRLQKTPWSRPIYSSWSYVFKTFSRRLQNVFKTSSSRIGKTSSSHLQDVFKTSSRRLQDFFKTPSRRLIGVLKTSSRHLQYVLQRCLQSAFRTYNQVILLCSSFQDIFKTYSQRFWGVLQRWLSTEGFHLITLQRNLWSVYKICKSDNSFSSFSLSLYHTF